MGSQGTLTRWHPRTYQKVVIALVVIVLIFVVSSATPGKESSYLRSPSSGEEPADPYTPSHVHVVELPDQVPSRVESQALPRYLEKDKDDVNPTLPAGVRKALVISSYKGQDLAWLDDLAKVSPGWEVSRYTPPEEGTDKPKLGREAGAYLQYIVDHYDNLSDFTIFNHGHDKSWHQPMRLLDAIVALNWTAVEEEQYVNLRCTEVEGCSDDTKYYFDKDGNSLHPDDKRWGYKIQRFWETTMRPQLGPMPEVIGRRCCAQFAVTKTAILHRPLIFYQELLAPLVEMNTTQLKYHWGDRPDDRFANLFETTWHMIFGKASDHCPSRDYCNKVHFQDFIHCDREVLGYKDADGWENIKCTNSLLGPE